MKFYVHGAGRSGREAWPEQAEAGAVFADHSDHRPMARKAVVVSELCPTEDVVFVAHSLGAVPAAHEAIAEQVTRFGAEHVRLEGAGHRPQDHPGFEAVLAEFTASGR